MRLGVHLVKFDFDGGPAAIGPTVAAVGAAAEEAGLDNVSVMDHYFQMPFLGGADRQMLEGYTTLGFLAAHTSPSTLAAAGHRRHLPAPWPARQDRDHARRALGRPCGARYRRGVVRAGARGARRPVPTGAGALRAARGDAADRAGRCGRRRRRRTTGSTTSWPRPSTRRTVAAGRRSWSAAPASGRRCGWSRSTPTPATSSPTRTAARPRSSRSSTCCAATATREGRDYDEIAKTILWSGRLDPAAADAFAKSMEQFAQVGVTEVHVMHLGDQPVEFVQELGRSVVPAIRDL